MPTVLIADDERSLRLLVRATFSMPNVRVIEAADGAQALEAVRRERPDLLLLDVQMPIMSGVEVCRTIRADPVLAPTKIIMLTARAQAADVQSGLAAGVDAYLPKPFSPLSLLKMASEMLGVEL